MLKTLVEQCLKLILFLMWIGITDNKQPQSETISINIVKRLQESMIGR